MNRLDQKKPAITIGELVPTRTDGLKIDIRQTVTYVKHPGDVKSQSRTIELNESAAWMLLRIDGQLKINEIINIAANDCQPDNVDELKKDIYHLICVFKRINLIELGILDEHPSTIVHRIPTLSESQVGDSIVLTRPEGGDHVSLTGMAAKIWSMIDGRSSLVDIVIRTAVELDHQPLSEIKSEATRLIESLVAKRFLYFNEFRFSIALIAVGEMYRQWCLTCVNSIRRNGRFDGIVHIFSDSIEGFDELENIMLHQIPKGEKKIDAKLWKMRLLDEIKHEDVLFLDVDVICGSSLPEFQSYLDNLRSVKSFYLFIDSGNSRGMFHSGVMLLKREANHILHRWRDSIIQNGRGSDQHSLKECVSSSELEIMDSSLLLFPELDDIVQGYFALFTHITFTLRQRRLPSSALRNFLVNDIGTDPIPSNILCLEGVYGFKDRLLAYNSATNAGFSEPEPAYLPDVMTRRNVDPDRSEASIDSQQKQFPGFEVVLIHGKPIYCKQSRPDQDGQVSTCFYNPSWQVIDFDPVESGTKTTIEEIVATPEQCQSILRMAIDIARQPGPKALRVVFGLSKSGLYFNYAETADKSVANWSSWANAYLGLLWVHANVGKNIPLSPDFLNKENKWELLNKYLDTEYRSNDRSLPKSHKIVVCMATIADRLDILPYAIDSILNQSIRPDKIHVYISKESYLLDEGINKEPGYFDYYRSRGVDFIYCPNHGQFRKTIESFTAYRGRSDTVCIYVDDDWVLPKHLVRDLYSGYRDFPQCVIGIHGKQLIYRENGEPTEYRTWPSARSGYSQYNFLQLLSGALVPGHLMNLDYCDWTAIQKCSPTSDEVWINNFLNKYRIPVYLVGTEFSRSGYRKLTNKEHKKLRFVNNVQVDGVRKKYQYILNMSDNFSREVLEQKPLRLQT